MIEEHIERLKEGNTLIRLTVVKGRGVKFELPCRIIAYDRATQYLTVYHVDEKQVYTFAINEVEEFAPA
ncbi:hypothetical protein [Paenibacillus thermotolerans]|uniref:hypothetical protein n=1 Tax=Paenibacillus thermotolerans TaxID=3027807 RepID=UPI0023678686|nr:MULTISPECIES: hypothetical protein [unclassified Paenibacillus]